MSDIANVFDVIQQVWDADHLVRDENGRDPLGYVHPDHIMYKAKTIRVQSLPEMRLPKYAALELENVVRFNPDVFYSFPAPIPKPSVNVPIGEPFQYFFKFAATTTIPSEYIGNEDFMRQVEGLLWRKIDAVEALFWFVYLTNVTYFLPSSVGLSSYREVFSLGRVFLARLSPQNEIDVLVAPRAYGAILLENMAGTSNSLANTEHHAASGYLNIIPVAMRYGAPPDGIYTEDLVCMYPRTLAERSKRYIYEAKHLDRVVEAGSDSNLKRLTCERYIAACVPIEHFINGDPYTAGVTLVTTSVTNAIASKYSATTLSELDNAASIA
jgi:hypothetical protein